MYFIHLNSWKCLLICLYFMDYKTIITNSKLVISFQIIKSQWEKFVASNCSNQCLKWHENLFSSHYRLIVLEGCERITTAFFVGVVCSAKEKLILFKIINYFNHFILKNKTDKWIGKFCWIFYQNIFLQNKSHSSFLLHLTESDSDLPKYVVLSSLPMYILW